MTTIAVRLDMPADLNRKILAIAALRGITKNAAIIALLSERLPDTDFGPLVS